MHDNDTPWAPSPRYPDERFEFLDPRGERFRVMNAAVERLATGTRWGEGPVWFGDHRCLLWSDIPNNRILRWDEETGATSIFRKPSNNANGHTRDRQGRLVSCEHLARRVTRTEPDGAITVIAERFEGRRLNSPNDVIVAPDGAVWFSDPPFGILGHYEGERAEPELPHAVYRVAPDGAISQHAIDSNGPNGLALSPDARTLYLVESRCVPRRILAFDVMDGALHHPRTVIQCAPGETPDGLRVDSEGNLWCGWGMGEGCDGVRVFAPDGTALLHIHLPERIANLCFGGRHRNRLFMSGCRSLYSVFVHARGVPGG